MSELMRTQSLMNEQTNMIEAAFVRIRQFEEKFNALSSEPVVEAQVDAPAQSPPTSVGSSMKLPLKSLNKKGVEKLIHTLGPLMITQGRTQGRRETPLNDYLKSREKRLKELKQKLENPTLTAMQRKKLTAQRYALQKRMRDRIHKEDEDDDQSDIS